MLVFFPPLLVTTLSQILSLEQLGFTRAACQNFELGWSLLIKSIGAASLVNGPRLADGEF